jgi:uncharacterized membrane protein YdbT with pleckstrin-like domain
MGYIDKNLVPGETILFRTNKNLIIFTAPLLMLLLTFIFCSNFYLIVSMNTVFDQITAQFSVLHYVHKLPALIMLLLTIYLALQQWLKWATSDYVVTDKRVVMREGIFDRYVCDTRLTTISHVTVDQNLLAQVLDYGTIAINGFGGNRDIFIQINHPTRFQQAVQTQLNK